MLSKGHAVPALYTVMARAGYFPQSQVITLRRLGESPAGTCWPLTDTTVQKLIRGVTDFVPRKRPEIQAASGSSPAISGRRRC